MFVIIKSGSLKKIKLKDKLGLRWPQNCLYFPSVLMQTNDEDDIINSKIMYLTFYKP